MSQRARRVEVNGHQEHYTALFHCWTRDENGKVLAVLETVCGGVKYEEPYKLRFMESP